MAVIVGKIFSAAAHTPRARSEIDFTESAMAISTPLDASAEPSEAHGEADGHSLQSPACPPREAINQRALQPSDAAGTPVR